MPPLKKSIGSSIKKKPEALPAMASKKAKTSSLKEQQAHKSMLNAIDKFYAACEEDDATATYMLSNVVGHKRQFDDPRSALINSPFYSSSMPMIAITLDNIVPRTKEFKNDSVITKKEMTDKLNFIVDRASEYSDEDWTRTNESLVTLSDMYDRLSTFFNAVTKLVRKQLSLRDEIPGESPKAKMGKWAWPQDRGGRQQKGMMPFEPSTKIEMKLLDAIVNHFLGDHLDVESAELIQGFLKKGQYADIIHEPNYNILYRGLAVPSKWMAKILGYKKTAELPAMGTVEKKFTFNPKKGGATSWSVDKKQSVIFAGDMKFHYPPGYEDDGHKIKEGETGLLMYAALDDNPHRFVSGPDGLYKLKDAQRYSDEKEAIGLGPIKVYKVEFVRYDVPEPKKNHAPKKRKG